MSFRRKPESCDDPQNVIYPDFLRSYNETYKIIEIIVFLDLAKTISFLDGHYLI